eukprot:UN00252
MDSNSLLSSLYNGNQLEYLQHLDETKPTTIVDDIRKMTVLTNFNKIVQMHDYTHRVKLFKRRVKRAFFKDIQRELIQLQTKQQQHEIMRQNLMQLVTTLFPPTMNNLNLLLIPKNKQKYYNNAPTITFNPQKLKKQVKKLNKKITKRHYTNPLYNQPTRTITTKAHKQQPQIRGGLQALNVSAGSLLSSTQEVQPISEKIQDVFVPQYDHRTITQPHDVHRINHISTRTYTTQNNNNNNKQHKNLIFQTKTIPIYDDDKDNNNNIRFDDYNKQKSTKNLSSKIKKHLITQQQREIFYSSPKTERLSHNHLNYNPHIEQNGPFRLHVDDVMRSVTKFSYINTDFNKPLEITAVRPVLFPFTAIQGHMTIKHKNTGSKKIIDYDDVENNIDISYYVNNINQIVQNPSQQLMEDRLYYNLAPANNTLVNPNVTFGEKFKHQHHDIQARKSRIIYQPTKYN